MTRSLYVKNGLSGSMSRSFRGHNVAYQCKGLDQSNIVCEYEVNLSTNDIVYNWKPKLQHKLLKNNVEYQGRPKVKVCNNVCEYEVNWLTNEKVIRRKWNF